MTTSLESLSRIVDYPDDEELCVATLGDRETVLAMAPDVYQGFDYLPSLYASLVTTKGVFGYLYKKRGHVVGFLSAQLVDNGQTLVTSAARIAPLWRGQGMYGRFTRCVFQQFLPAQNLRHIAMTVNNQTMASCGSKMLKTYKVILEQTATWIELNTKEAKNKASKQQSEVADVKQLTRDELLELLVQNPRHLFPAGRICVDVKPYRVMAENLDMIINTSRHSLFLASHGNSGVGHDSRESVTSLLSCGSYYICSRGVFYQLDVFGTGNDDQMRAHLEWHLLRLLQLSGDDEQAFCYVLSPGDISDAVRATSKDLPLKVDIGLPYNKHSLLEIDLEG